jgi:hypothetical protein
MTTTLRPFFDLRLAWLPSRGRLPGATHLLPGRQGQVVSIRRALCGLAAPADGWRGGLPASATNRERLGAQGRICGSCQASLARQTAKLTALKDSPERRQIFAFGDSGNPAVRDADGRLTDFWGREYLLPGDQIFICAENGQPEVEVELELDEDDRLVGQPTGRTRPCLVGTDDPSEAELEAMMTDTAGKLDRAAFADEDA